jgi:hypothetical protein
MPRGGGWTEKDDRMYEHVKQSELDRGRSEDRAEEIAARTVNQQAPRRGTNPRQSHAGYGQSNAAL